MHTYSINNIWNETDYKETDSSIELEFDIPGFKKDEVSIKVKSNLLSINVSPDEKNKRKGFSSVYKLHESLDASLVVASVENGVLKIVLPKKESAKIKEYSVKIS